MAEKNVKLKKCPFCGSEVGWHTDLLCDFSGIECQNLRCGARFKFPGCWDKETVARKFNERKP